MSPSDSLRKTRLKMLAWIENGAELGWMVNPKNHTVAIYRRGQAEPEVRKGIAELAGESRVAGFVLDLSLVCDAD